MSEEGDERKQEDDAVSSEEQEQLAQLFDALGVSSLGEAIVRAQVIQGNGFFALDDVLESAFEECREEHFTSLCRDWNNCQITNSEVLKVYQATRTASLNVTTRASATNTLTSLKDGNERPVRPVRVCSHKDTDNYAEKAHLCPKTGAVRKVDTWIYVAAAVLGMEYDSAENRLALLKALRGSVKAGNVQAIDFTGLNRCPFNMLSFLGQELWYDTYPGVVALPCLDPIGARDWDGTGYSVIILCDNVPFVTTANDISVRIGLTQTPPEHLHEASADDISNAFLLLKQVVLASAYCVSAKAGPDTVEGKNLWQEYKKQLQINRSGAHAISGNAAARRGVTVPKLKSRPAGKFVAKIDLREMSSPIPGSTPAIPDPLLLAYKSSVNWTRKYDFQLIAEAEPLEDEASAFPTMFVHTDQGSKSSAYGSLGAHSV